MLNKQGPGKIDWTDWTWNPITGCLHGCPYCYMKRMEKRFSGIMEPKFKPQYIDSFLASKKVKPGDKVFVGSSGDMWGEWVPYSWIAPVISIADQRPDVTFQFLTKNPAMYGNWKLNQTNCWFGTSVDGTPATRRNLDLLIRNTQHAKVRFVSFEPLLKDVSVFKNIVNNICLLDWIIIGADSNKGAKQPPIEWAESLINTARTYNIPVFVKDNYKYKEIIKEFPKGVK